MHYTDIHVRTKLSKIMVCALLGVKRRDIGDRYWLVFINLLLLPLWGKQ